MASVEWYWAKDGKTNGPLRWEELRAAAKRGDFGPGDWVWSPAYGKDWQRASILEAVFADKGGAGAGESREEPGAAEESAAAGAGNDPVSGWRRQQAEAETPSPFADAARDGRGPEIPRTARSLKTAWLNAVRLLLHPFSWRRYGAYAFAALLLLLGSQVVSPLGLPMPGFPEKLAASGLDTAGGIPQFASKWAGIAARGAASSIDPAALTTEFSAALRHTASSFANWMANTSGHLAVSLGWLLMLAVAAGLHSWFLARGWAVMLHRVYRRDEPVVRSWADAREPAGAIFRGAFVLRLVMGCGWILAAWSSAVRLAALPEGVPPPESVSHGFAPLAIMALVDAVAMVFARDFAVPRVVLTGASFAAAMRAAAGECGFWTVRHLLMLAMVAPAFAAVAFFLMQPLLALVPQLFPLLAAFFLAPWHLLRSLWALDLFFRLHPEARKNVPPRARIPPELAERLSRRGA